MAYISKEDIKAIRDKLKKEFPNLKLSVKSYNSNSGIDIDILAGNIDFFNLLSKECDWSPYQIERRYIQVNEYRVEEAYLGEAKDALSKILSICKSQKACYDRNFNDPGADYGDMTYFLNISIGRWDKPYELVKEAA